jgi:hypothetical protein
VGSWCGMNDYAQNFSHGYDCVSLSESFKVKSE